MNNLRRIRLIVLLLIFILAAGIILVIIKLNTGNTSKERVTNGPNVTKLHMSWWGNDSRHKYTMEGVDLFQEKNPSIDVEYRYGEWNGYEKRNKVWMESHTEADVMQINYAWLSEYSYDGSGFYDLNELADYIDLDNFTDEEKEYGTKNGKLNALPIAMNTHVFYYNQDILDKYNMTVPETFEDLFKLGNALADDGIYALGISKKQLFILLAAYYQQNYGKAMFNNDGSLAIDEKGIAFLLDFYKKMLDENVLCPVELFERSKYLSGKMAGTMCWISDTKVYCDGLADTGAKVSRGSYPVIRGAKDSGWYIKPATMWAISADTPHPKEAAMLLNYLLNDPDMVKLQQTEKGVPVSDAAIATLSEEGLAQTNEYKAMQEIMEHQDEMHLMIPSMENENIIEAFKTGADEYIFDKLSLEDCSSKIYRNMRDILSESK